MTTRSHTTNMTDSNMTNPHNDIPSNKQPQGDQHRERPERLEYTKRSRRTYACFFSWVAVIVVAVFIFYMSAKTAQTLDDNSGIISLIKQALTAGAAQLFGHEVDISPIGHFCEFFLLGAALCNALRFSISPKASLIVAAVLASAYGISDELHQLFVPTRSCDPLDWIVDTVAALIGALLVHGIMHAVAKRRK